jgi:hypothetical protein
MPTEPKPLFRPEALRSALAAFHVPPAAVAARPKLTRWAKLLATRQGAGMKETELRDEFIYDVFRDLLGYVSPVDVPDRYTLKKEALIQVDGTYADAAFGRFAPQETAVIAVLEGKGPGDPLDKPYKNRKRSAVEQAVLYALQLRIDWYLVTNLRETRLYCKRDDTAHFERFETATIAADDAEFRRFVFLLGAERVVGTPGRNHLDELLTESKRIGRELTAGYYREYRDLRAKTFDALRHHNPNEQPRELLAAAQKILDRVLFICFCEDRGLLPAEIVSRAYRHTDPFNPRPVWENFKGLFRAVDRGNDPLQVFAYNGGLFAPDPFVDGLVLPDGVCEGFKRLADFEYGTAYRPDAKNIDVEILGHIFEQSISDLEELHQQLAPAAETPAAAKAEPSKRKREGAFYTPEFITRYIVAETLGPVLRERFETLRADHEAAVPKKGEGAKAKAVLRDPRAFDPGKLNESQRKALVRFWGAWMDALETVRIVDPACGSGAFLIEAFDQMFAEYDRAQGYLRDLEGPTLFDVRRAILTHNLFGMDLNGEAVEIARLSCWIKTAEKGKQLTALDGNIRCGNSVAGKPSPLTFWRAEFPGPMGGGGFDVVIANPPYVRQEWISADKPFLQQHYKAYDGVADLYVYFYELALNLLRPGGRLGFIVTNKWMKAGYGEPLRQLYGEAAWLETVVDLGHNKQIFPDADVFPCILTARRPDAGPAPDTARVCVLPREQTRVDDLSRQIADEGVSVPRTRFGADPWNLEPPGVAKLMDKLRRVGVPLKEFIGGVPYRGIMTGFNDAFLIDTPTKERLVIADLKSAGLLKPYLRGQDVDRWRAGWSGLWMIAMKSSANHPWPWAKAADPAAAEAIFAKSYPALHEHMAGYRAELSKRGDKGLFWWELRACAYWDMFDAPKVMYQEIQFHPCYALDTAGMLANNKVFFIPTDDPYLIAVLNSPLMWWHNWRYLPHMKDEALSPVGFRMEELPIAEPTDAQRSDAEAAVRRLVELAREQQDRRAAVLDWLRAEFAVEKPSLKLQTPADLDADGFIAEVKKGRKKGLGVADVKRLKDEHAQSVAPLRTLAREAETLERRVSDLVNAAFGLTPKEVALMWQTAPPRMPITPA